MRMLQSMTLLVSVSNESDTKHSKAQDHKEYLSWRMAAFYIILRSIHIL